MKKSKHIQLVLITAALAGCNRAVIPQMQPKDIAPDSTLIAVPVYYDSTYANNPNDCGCEDFYPETASTYSPYSTFYIGPGYGNYYYTGRRYSKAAVVRSNKVIVRAGFGKTSVGSAAS